jgi:hypothetical protein
MGHMRYAATLFVSLALGACAINAPALGPAAPYDSGYLRITVADDVQPEDRQAVQGLVDATLQVITSDHFRDNLVRLDGATSRLWLSPYGETMSLEDVARVYRGEHQEVRPIPTVVQVNHRNSTPAQGFYYEPAFHSRITLTSDVLTRWRSDSIEQKSCAVNTLAHEISHTFSSSTTQGEWVIADAGKGEVAVIPVRRAGVVHHRQRCAVHHAPGARASVRGAGRVPAAMGDEPVQQPGVRQRGGRELIGAHARRGRRGWLASLTAAS